MSAICALFLRSVALFFHPLQSVSSALSQTRVRHCSTFIRMYAFMRTEVDEHLLHKGRNMGLIKAWCGMNMSRRTFARER